MVTIMDSGKHEQSVLDSGDHTYQVFPLPASPPPPSMPSWTTIDTKKTTKLLGHVCRHYILKHTDMSTGGQILSIDVLAATDISVPGPQIYFIEGIAPGLAKDVPGLPMAATIHYTNGSLHNYLVTALSLVPLPKNAFDIPKGFKKKDQ